MIFLSFRFGFPLRNNRRSGKGSFDQTSLVERKDGYDGQAAARRAHQQVADADCVSLLLLPAAREERWSRGKFAKLVFLVVFKHEKENAQVVVPSGRG